MQTIGKILKEELVDALFDQADPEGHDEGVSLDIFIADPWGLAGHTLCFYVKRVAKDDIGNKEHCYVIMSVFDADGSDLPYRSSLAFEDCRSECLFQSRKLALEIIERLTILSVRRERIVSVRRERREIVGAVKASAKASQSSARL